VTWGVRAWTEVSRAVMAPKDATVIEVHNIQPIAVFEVPKVLPEKPQDVNVTVKSSK